MRLKIAGYPTDHESETDPQSIDLKEIMISADAKTLRRLAEFFRRSAEEIETNGKNFKGTKFPEGDTDLPEFFVFDIDE
ncbi:MAG: hypothetical protein ACE1ZH_01070 [Gammaproteobacteria bacterium]